MSGDHRNNRWPKGEVARPWPQFGGIDVRLGAVEVEGCDIRYRHLVREGAPTVVLIHGGSAHSGWWAATAAQLASTYDVVLPDLSGHGDSGHRTDYAPEGWAAELADVIRDCESRRPFIVGHSIGGLVGVYLSASAPAEVAGLVLVDTRLKPPVESAPVTERVDGRGQYRVYETKQQGIARFRLVPADTMADPATLHFLAEEGLRRVPDGWTWKSDPNSLRRFTDEAVHDRLAEVACPVGYVFGEHSLFGGLRSAQYLEQRLCRPISIRAVAGSFHHVPLDAPIECATAIDDMLSAFQEASRR